MSRHIPRISHARNTFKEFKQQAEVIPRFVQTGLIVVTFKSCAQLLKISSGGRSKPYLEDVFESLQSDGDYLSVVYLQKVAEGRDASLLYEVLDLLRLTATGGVRNRPSGFL